MMTLATGMNKKELSWFSERLAGLSDVDHEDGDDVIGATVDYEVENDLIEEHRFVPQEGGSVGNFQALGSEDSGKVWQTSGTYNHRFQRLFKQGASVCGLLGPSSSVPPCAGRPISTGESLLKRYVKDGCCETSLEHDSKNGGCESFFGAQRDEWR